MAVDAYIYFAGTTGTSQAPGAPTTGLLQGSALSGPAIPISDFTVGVTEAISIGQTTGGGIAGKPSLSAFSFTKTVDEVTTQIFNAAVTGKPFPSASILLARSATTGTFVYLEYQLTTVYVTSDQFTFGGDSVSEAVALVFDQIEILYRTQNADGTPGTTSSITYNGLTDKTS